MLAIIPARGGSKGLPGKNVKFLLGKPLIAYAVENALASKYISEVIVSTDDKEIANVAVHYGAVNPFMRPHELATDSALAVDTFIYTIERLNESRIKKIENFIVLQPSSPLRLNEDVDGAIELFYQKKADSVVTYCIENHPIHWHKYLNSDNSFTEIFEDFKVRNRQEKRRSYYPNGAAFVFKYSIIKRKLYYTDKSYGYIMPRNRSVDIDTLEDFEYAEFLLNKRKVQNANYCTLHFTPCLPALS